MQQRKCAQDQFAGPRPITWRVKVREDAELLFWLHRPYAAACEGCKASTPASDQLDFTLQLVKGTSAPWTVTVLPSVQNLIASFEN